MLSCFPLCLLESSKDHHHHTENFPSFINCKYLSIVVLIIITNNATNNNNDNRIHLRKTEHQLLMSLFCWLIGERREWKRIMRTLCDACESAAAFVFCAADEAALCRACDDKVHLCNKLASRHVRVGLANPSDVPRCDICENAPAFFYCEVDGSSLCLQCDMLVHVGGKRTHGRYLLLRQRIEFPGDKLGQHEDPASQPVDPGETRRGQNQPPKLTMGENQQNHRVSSVPMVDANTDRHVKVDTKMIDLNMKPHRIHEQAPND